MNRSRSSWRRVSRRNCCPICSKPDWCLIAVDGSAAICSRVQSERPAGRSGSGWIHRLTNNWTTPVYQSRYIAPPKPKRDWEAMAVKCCRNMSDSAYEKLGHALGLSAESLRRLGVGWDQARQVFTIPMRNAIGDVVGVRTRSLDGSKRAVTGSDGNGLFFVPGSLSAEYLLICEGPTDACSLMDCGFGSTIGRPSCSLGTEFVIEIINTIHPNIVLLVPDRDDAGLAGFAELATAIVSRTWLPITALDAITPPKGIKDVRQWKKNSREHLARTITANLENIKQRNGGTE